jgi:hypothetical protein
MSPGSPEPPDLDDLRRRLYVPGASPEDVGRYEAAAGRPEGDLEPTLPAGRRSRSRRIAAVVGTLVAGVALAVGVAAVVGAVAGGPRPAPSASPSPAVLVMQLAAPAPARAAFDAALGSGRQAGLLQYLYRHPDRLPPAILTVGRADSTEYSGEGPTTVSLSPSALAERGGRVTVILVLGRTGRYQWRSIRVAATNDVVGPGAAVTSDGGELQAGAPVAGTFSYGRGAPSRLRVVVADRTRWGAVVVFTD